jgi:hypothetical protein
MTLEEEGDLVRSAHGSFSSRNPMHNAPAHTITLVLKPELLSKRGGIWNTERGPWWVCLPRKYRA